MMTSLYTPMDELEQELHRIDGVGTERNASAAPLCTYRVGGPIALLVRVDRADALGSVVAKIAAARVPVLVIGKGSNLLVADAGFDGVGVLLGDPFTEVSIDGTVVTAGASAALPVTARATVNAGLGGFEWAVGVPGTIGGAVRMNAGGHGSDMAASLVEVDIADLRSGEVTTRDAATLDLQYRHSNLKAHELVVAARLQLEPLDNAGDEPVGSSLLKEIVGWRREHQPGGANAGSVFTNPPGDSAGRLIDTAGLKGMRVGTAEVSTKHANFIQADPDGSADDVIAVMVKIVDHVQQQFGVRLHAETRLIGFRPEVVDHVQQQSPGSSHG